MQKPHLAVNVIVAVFAREQPIKDGKSYPPIASPKIKEELPKATNLCMSYLANVDDPSWDTFELRRPISFSCPR